MDKNEVISAIKNLTLGDLAVLFGSGQKEDSSQSVCVTKEELMSTKQILDKDDIMKLLNISKDKAYKIIRSINAYSNSLDIEGRVLVQDYLAWANRPRVKKEN